jgi:hypothetical protein
MKKSLLLLVTVFLLLLAFAGCQQECTHDYKSEITQAASCTQAGVETFTCTKCNHSYTQPVAMLEHSYDEGVVQKEASCTEEGQTRYTCSGCNGTVQEPIAKLAHTLVDPTVTKEPNCSEEGECTGTCTVCGTENVTEKIPVNDAHHYENAVVREPTCTDPGEGLDTCTLCGHTKSCQYDYKAHAYGQAETITAATCTKDGKAKATCTVCGATEDRKISAPGHKWTGATCQKAGTCSVCGATGSKAKHDYEVLSRSTANMKYYAERAENQCKICGEKKTLYYVDDAEFDIEYIQSVLDDYARSYGFVNIVHSTSELDSNKKSWKTLEVFKVPWYKEPVEYIIEQGKLLIDYQYQDIKNSTFPMERRLLHLQAGYWSSGSLGCGMFQVYIGLTELPKE